MNILPKDRVTLKCLYVQVKTVGKIFFLKKMFYILRSFIPLDYVAAHKCTANFAQVFVLK